MLSDLLSLPARLHGGRARTRSPASARRSAFAGIEATARPASPTAASVRAGSQDPARRPHLHASRPGWERRPRSGPSTHGGQSPAFAGDPAWSPERRFERLFERLAFPGLGRMGRYDLLVTLGGLGLYELRADSLHLSACARRPRAISPRSRAKRLFAIADPLHLERRADALAQAIAVPLATLDLAFANWTSPERATLGSQRIRCDREALGRAHDALGV